MLLKTALLLSAAGGVLQFCDANGEVLGEVYVPPGRVRVSDYWDLIPDGGSINVGDGLSVFNPRGGYGVIDADAPYESGANPDFRPTSASRLEMEMRVQLNRMQAATTRLERREAALASVQRVPDNPQVTEPVGGPSVEPIDEEAGQ